MSYISTFDYTFQYEAGHAASFRYHGKPVVQNLTASFDIGEKRVSLADYPMPTVQQSIVPLNSYERHQRRMELRFEAPSLPTVCLMAEVGTCGLHIRLGCDEALSPVLCGDILWGEQMQTDTFAVSLEENFPMLRGAVGPASDRNDHALLDRLTGRLLIFNRESRSEISFDYAKQCYCFRCERRDFELSVQEDYYQKLYGVHYKPINKNCSIKGPNAGFGTYYPWLFQYDETDLMETVQLMHEKLLDFGANMVIVDIEWVRNDTQGSKDFKGDHFHPDLERFPSGMKAVADKIKEAGFVPQLWVGITCEPSINEEMKRCPDIVFADIEDSWCGRYFLDLTNPYFQDVYLPKFCKQVREWGYPAIKWDLVGETYDALDQYHENLADPSQSSPQILRSTVENMRHQLGDENYICYCAALGQEELRISADLTDCMRIGRDVWSWNNFKEQMLFELCSHYPLHDVMTYCDPDHLIIADQRFVAADTCLNDPTTRAKTFTTRDEAISRLTPVVLLGQCFNIGDDLRTLSEERMDMLRRGLPVADVHPQNLAFSDKQNVMPILVQVSKTFENWSVFALINTEEFAVERSFSLTKDLGLAPGRYFLFDYWENKLLTVCEDNFTVALRPHQTVNYAIRKVTGRPQVVSSARHMLQGAVELNDVCWNEAEKKLVIEAECIADYPYAISIFVPDAYRCSDQTLTAVETRDDLHGALYTLRAESEKTGAKRWVISFTDAAVD